MRPGVGVETVRAAAAAAAGVGVGGVVHVSRLTDLGLSKAGIRRLVVDGCLRPVIRGWYATETASVMATDALELGGRVGCVSLLRMLGVWAHDDGELHIDFPRHESGRRLIAAEKRASRAVVVHWTDIGPTASPTGALEDALGRAVVCQQPDFAIASLDSALHQRMLSRDQLLRRVISRLPLRYRRLADLVDARAESGLESIARLRLRRAGFDVAVQEPVLGGRYRLDLLVNGRVAVELDGREFHNQEAAFLADRRRDAVLVSSGYVVARFAYAQVLYEWPTVEQTVRALVSTAA